MIITIRLVNNYFFRLCRLLRNILYAANILYLIRNNACYLSNILLIITYGDGVHSMSDNLGC